MTPLGIMKVLRKNGLEYESIRAKKMSSEVKLQFLKDHLKRGPLILLIASGMTKKKAFFSDKSSHPLALYHPMGLSRTRKSFLCL